MADLSITAAQVQTDSIANCSRALAGEAITAGQTLYKKAADGKMWKADCDASAATAACLGIAVCDAAAEQVVSFQTKGTVLIGAGASVAQGTPYFLSPTAGGIGLDVDILAADFLVYLGIGDDADGIVLDLHLSKVAHA